MGGPMGDQNSQGKSGSKSIPLGGRKSHMRNTVSGNINTSGPGEGGTTLWSTAEKSGGDPSQALKPYISP